MKFLYRIYEDYFMKSRMELYRELISLFFNNGYEMHSVLSFYNLAQNNQLDGRKIFINRHDIDTSVNRAEEMFNIELDVYGKSGSATYYFRNSTQKKSFLGKLDSYGYESGYHYEEIASYCKKHNVYSKEIIVEKIPNIQQLFIENCQLFRLNNNVNLYSVASHGDHINRKLKITNKYLVTSDVLKKSNILVEAYDVEDKVEARFSDTLPTALLLENVKKAISEKKNRILVLTHPRHWRKDLVANSKDNILRIYEEIKYRL